MYLECFPLYHCLTQLTLTAPALFALLEQNIPVVIKKHWRSGTFTVNTVVKRSEVPLIHVDSGRVSASWLTDKCFLHQGIEPEGFPLLLQSLKTDGPVKDIHSNPNKKLYGGESPREL